MNIGFGNQVPWWRVVAILLPNTSPAKTLRNKAEDEGRLINSCAGRPRRSMIITDANQIIVCAVSAETLIERLEKKRVIDLEKTKTTEGETV